MCVSLSLTHPLRLDPVVGYLLDDGLEVLLALDLHVGQVQNLNKNLDIT